MTIVLSSLSSRGRRAARSRLVLLLTVAMLTGLTACDLAGKRENLKNCEFELENLEIASFSFTKVELLVHVGIQNPNPSDVVVDRLTFELFTGDNKVADGKHTENIIVPAGERRSIKIDVTTTPNQLGNTLVQALMSNGDVDYRVEGIVYLDTILGEIPYPVNIEGNTADSGPNN
ncbi:MAG: LEA type 2 family protein [Leptospirales bacterium]|jgi:LEA14-like dessication related protein